MEERLLLEFTSSDSKHQAGECGMGGLHFQCTFDPSVLGVVHRNKTSRIHGDSGQEMLDLITNNPSVAVPIIVKRLWQKGMEWKATRDGLNRHWKELAEMNYCMQECWWQHSILVAHLQGWNGNVKGTQDENMEVQLPRVVASCNAQFFWTKTLTNVWQSWWQEQHWWGCARVCHSGAHAQCTQTDSTSLSMLVVALWLAVPHISTWKIIIQSMEPQFVS